MARKPVKFGKAPTTEDTFLRRILVSGQCAGVCESAIEKIWCALPPVQRLLVWSNLTEDERTVVKKAVPSVQIELYPTKSAMTNEEYLQSGQFRNSSAHADLRDGCD